MIKFFAKHTYLLEEPGVPDSLHLRRVSSRVKGEEIAAYLQAPYNQPREKDDVCVFVKPRHISRVHDGDYVEVLDEADIYIPQLKERPRINVLAMSLAHYDYLKSKLENNIVYLPHHHCNFSREKRLKNPCYVVAGLIGPPSEITSKICEEIKTRLKEVGIEFLTCFDYKERKDTINFYKKIDLQIIWYHKGYNPKDPYRHPTKLMSAASMGIPTITQPMDGYREIEGFYIPIENMDDLVKEAVKFKEHAYWQEWSDEVFRKAEEFHISNIAKLYEEINRTSF